MQKLIKILSVLTAVLLLSFNTTPISSAYGAESKEYEESLEQIVNPGCGFYKAFSGYLLYGIDTPVISEDKISEDAGKYGLFHLRIGLENFSKNAGGVDREIDEKALTSLKTTFDYLRKYKTGAIIRFSYNVTGEKDADGNYLENEPSLTLICNHIKALGGVIGQYSDVILGVESGMLGPWGEQHSTTLASSNKSNSQTYHKVVQTWLDNTPENIGVTVRRPLYFTYWINNEYSLNLSVKNLAGFDASAYVNGARVGVYNDGYLGSSSDRGTFSNREVEVEFIGKQANNTYYGGEVIADNKTDGIGSYNCVEYLEKEAFITHTSYLNIDWNYDDVISVWQSETYDGTDSLYYGKTSDFVFVNNRLGYRLVARKIDIDSERATGETLNLTLEIENVGFARMLRKPKANLIFKTDSKTEAVNCELDLSTVYSKERKTFNLAVTVPEGLSGNCDVYLSLQTEYNSQIRLATEGLIYSEEIGGHKLGTFSVTEKSSTPAKFLVTFDTNYGRVVQGSTSQIVNEGESAVAPTVERNGYVFVGWDVDFSCITQNTAVTAIWEKVNENSENSSSYSSSSADQSSSSSQQTTEMSCNLSVESNLYLLIAFALSAVIKHKKSAV